MTTSDEALQRGHRTLPPDQRQAIKMLKLNEMSLKEAAAVSGRSIAALKVATHTRRQEPAPDVETAG